MRKHRVVVADPPWPFRDRLPGKEHWRGAGKHYGLLSLSELIAFPLPPIADDALLFLWRVSSMQLEAISLCKGWGFEPVGEMVWRKVTSSGGEHFGMGRIVRASHESILIGKRGKPKIRSHSVRSLFSAGVGRHSEKPDAFFDLVEELAAGPYLEVFARKERKGWTVIGDEV